MTYFTNTNDELIQENYKNFLLQELENYSNNIIYHKPISIFQIKNYQHYLNDKYNGDIEKDFKIENQQKISYIQEQRNNCIKRIKENEKEKIKYLLEKVKQIILNDIKNIYPDIYNINLKNNSNYTLEELGLLIHEDRAKFIFKEIAKFITSKKAENKYFNGLEIQYLPFYIRRNKFFKREILKKFGFALIFCEEIDFEDIFRAIENEPFVISLLPDYIRNSNILLFLAIKNNLTVLKYTTNQYIRHDFVRKFIFLYLYEDININNFLTLIDRDVLSTFTPIDNEKRMIEFMYDKTFKEYKEIGLEPTEKEQALKEFKQIEKFIQDYKEIIDYRDKNDILTPHRNFFEEKIPDELNQNYKLSPDEISKLDEKTLSHLNIATDFLNRKKEAFINIQKNKNLKTQKNFLGYNLSLTQWIENYPFVENVNKDNEFTSILEINDIEKFEFYFNKTYNITIYKYRNNFLKTIKSLFFKFIDEKDITEKEYLFDDEDNNEDDEYIDFKEKYGIKFDYYDEIYKKYYMFDDKNLNEKYEPNFVYSSLYNDITYIYEKVLTEKQKEQFINYVIELFNNEEYFKYIQYLPKIILNDKNFQYNLRKLFILNMYKIKNNLFYLIYINKQDFLFKEIEYYCYNEPFFINILNPIVKEDNTIKTICFLVNPTILKSISKYYNNIASIYSIININENATEYERKLLEKILNVNIDEIELQLGEKQRKILQEIFAQKGIKLYDEKRIETFPEYIKEFKKEFVKNALKTNSQAKVYNIFEITSLYAQMCLDDNVDEKTYKLFRDIAEKLAVISKKYICQNLTIKDEYYYIYKTLQEKIQNIN